MKTANKIPGWFLGKSFVVFNIEIKGLNFEQDKIIKIGAVKIEEGNKSFF